MNALKRNKILILGDVVVDTIVKGKIPNTFKDISGGIIIENEILHIPGGSGLLFAEFLHNYNYDYLLYAKLGKDFAGRQIINYINARNLNCHIIEHDSDSTGESLIIRDGDDCRLLITSKDSSNKNFTLEDVEYIEEYFCDVDVLYISGHFLKEKDSIRFKSVLSLLQKIKDKNKIAILDIVPHTIYTEFCFDEYYDIIKSVDIIFSDVSTIRRFLNIGNKGELITDDIALETGKELQQYFKKFVLRYGVNSIDSELISSPCYCEDIFIKKISLDIINSHEKRGFGDFLCVLALKEYFEIE